MMMGVVGKSLGVSCFQGSPFGEMEEGISGPVKVLCLLYHAAYRPEPGADVTLDGVTRFKERRAQTHCTHLTSRVMLADLLLAVTYRVYYILYSMIDIVCKCVYMYLYKYRHRPCSVALGFAACETVDYWLGVSRHS